MQAQFVAKFSACRNNLYFPCSDDTLQGVHFLKVRLDRVAK